MRRHICVPAKSSDLVQVAVHQSLVLGLESEARRLLIFSVGIHCDLQVITWTLSTSNTLVNIDGDVTVLGADYLVTNMKLLSHLLSIASPHIVPERECWNWKYFP